MKKKNQIQAIVIIVVIPILFMGCSKSSSTSAPLPPTQLQIIIEDDLGNPLSGASVKLYSSQSDWQNIANQIGATQYSDASGHVTFTNLSAIKYYWYAEKTCQNNITGSSATVNAISANKTNTVNCSLVSTGTLSFKNNSTNPYHVYINNQLVFDMQGGASNYAPGLPLGSYAVKVVQISGYAVSPTIEQGSFTLSSCGSVISIAFP